MALRHRPTLSVCLITHELAWFLPHVLRNVEAVADEIVVLDSFSKDGSAELLKAHPKVRLQWIRAHDGSLWNEYADALSTSYMRR